MRDLKDSLKSSGYSFEEYYFHQLNQKLIEQIREKYRNDKVVSLSAVREEMAARKAEGAAANAPPAEVIKTKKAA